MKQPKDIEKQAETKADAAVLLQDEALDKVTGGAKAVQMNSYCIICRKYHDLYRYIPWAVSYNNKKYSTAAKFVCEDSGKAFIRLIEPTLGETLYFDAQMNRIQ